jgi:hypothetical protein
VSCTRLRSGGFICQITNGFYRLRLADGTCVFMSWHHYLGPVFFRDRDERREIQDWYDNKLICDQLDWFIERGKRA